MQAFTAERERVHRARAARLVLPFIPPLVVVVLIIAGVLPVPRGLPGIALWLILIALYASMWLFLVRDARRLAAEAAAVDRRFRAMAGAAPFDAVAVLPGVRGEAGGEADDGVVRDGPVLALVGRPIDARDADVARFALTAVADVRTRLDRYMARVRPSAVVCSAACGADLLALDVAEARRVRRRVVLPYERGRFRHFAVTNRPGTWGPLFDRILGALPSEEVVVVGHLGDGHDPRRGAPVSLHTAILDQAGVVATAAAAASPGASGAGEMPPSPLPSPPREIGGTTSSGDASGVGDSAEAIQARRNVVAVIVWEGRASGADVSSSDPVAAFRAEAGRRGIRVDEIPTI